MTDHECIHCSGHDVEQVMSEKIAEHGWTATGVKSDRGHFPFVYTTGLTKLGQPELIMIGIPIQLGYGVIQDTIDAMHEGLVLEAGKTYPNLVSGDYELAVVEVIDPLNPEYPQSCTTIFYGETFRSYQLVWPDQKGRYPWDEGSQVSEQPVLGVWEPA